MNGADLPQPQLPTPAQALSLVLARVQPTQVETVVHAQCLSRTLGAPVHSSLDLPPFDNSAMDGYAVIAADLEPASPQAPVHLALQETVAAGDVPTLPLQPGTCCKIMTGAPIPPGCDAVVMREDVTAAANEVRFFSAVPPATNIRRAGSDIGRGELVLEAGTRVDGPQWAMLAALGQPEVTVYRRPRVAIVATGAELVDVDAPLRPGHIRDSNSFALRAAAMACDAEVTQVLRVGDSLEEVRTALDKLAATVDMIVTSGGVSAGDYDPVRDVLHADGKVHFWKVAMKPGKPVLFATYRDTPVLALPGNPVSVMVAWEIFVRRALLKMAGRTQWHRPELTVQLDHEVRSTAGRAEYVRARVDFAAEPPTARTTGDQGSGRLSSMLAANALLKVPAEATLLQRGERVPAILIGLPETA